MFAKRKATQPHFEHFGFTERGSLFPLESPSHDALSLILPGLLKNIREKFLSPADVEMMLRLQSERVRSAFPNAPQWTSWTRAWQWFVARTSTSAEELVKRSVPVDQDWLETAERFHGYECRFAGLPETVEVFGHTLERNPGTCRVHPTEIPHPSESG